MRPRYLHIIKKSLIFSIASCVFFNLLSSSPSIAINVPYEESVKILDKEKSKLVDGIEKKIEKEGYEKLFGSNHYIADLKVENIQKYDSYEKKLYYKKIVNNEKISIHNEKMIDSSSPIPMILVENMCVAYFKFDDMIVSLRKFNSIERITLNETKVLNANTLSTVLELYIKKESLLFGKNKKSLITIRGITVTLETENSEGRKYTKILSNNFTLQSHVTKDYYTTGISFLNPSEVLSLFLKGYKIKITIDLLVHVKEEEKEIYVDTYKKTFQISPIDKNEVKELYKCSEVKLPNEAVKEFKNEKEILVFKTKKAFSGFFADIETFEEITNSNKYNSLKDSLEYIDVRYIITGMNPVIVSSNKKFIIFEYGKGEYYALVFIKNDNVDNNLFGYNCKLIDNHNQSNEYMNCEKDGKIIYLVKAYRGNLQYYFVFYGNDDMIALKSNELFQLFKYN